MRKVYLLTGVFLLFAFSSSGHTGFLALIEELGVLIKPATFWIGTPEEPGAMAYLKIPQGTKVKILAEEGKYFRINHKDLIGYVESKAIRLIAPGEEVEKKVSVKPTPSPPSYSGTGFYLVTERTSLREGPDSQANVILRLPVDGRVEVLEHTGKYWWKIKYNGETGWAKAALLRKE
ncbi:MAG: SH3 domain-containing protein [Lewinellaceae bacterium]|nr:SH3 domain-containing protein [Lewinellaceae bacterium]